jgi:DnaJ-class molecular chaperone
MPAKNYYVVLGVSRDESSAGIRTAYHELASHLRPGLTGPPGASRSQEIDEAYEVLSGPARRREHDRESGAADLGTEVPAPSQPSRPASPGRSAWRR